MAKLFLVRHGDTAANSRRRYWGRTDVALSDAGKEQAAALAERLAGEKLRAVYSSDLERASFTAAAIAARHRLPVTIRPELREIDFGELEGMTFDEIARDYPDVAGSLSRRERRFQFPGGESFSALQRRLKRFERYLAGYGPEDNIVVVAHSGALRTLTCLLLKLGTKHRWQFRLDMAGLCIIDTYPQGGILTRWNDTGHLGRVGTGPD